MVKSMGNDVKLSGLALIEAQFWPAVARRDCSVEFPPDEDGVQRMSALDSRGREVPDPVPMSPPIGYREGASLAEFVQRMIRQEVSRVAEMQQFESFEEADDFEVDDDGLEPGDLPTIYEAFLDQSTGRPFAVPDLAAGALKEPGGGGGPPPPQASPASPESPLLREADYGDAKR